MSSDISTIALDNATKKYDTNKSSYTTQLLSIMRRAALNVSTINSDAHK